MYSKSVFYRPPALEESNQESEEEEDIDESWSDEKVQEEIDRISVLRDLTGIIKNENSTVLNSFYCYTDSDFIKTRCAQFVSASSRRSHI